MKNYLIGNVFWKLGSKKYTFVYFFVVLMNNWLWWWYIHSFGKFFDKFIAYAENPTNEKCQIEEQVK